MSNKIEILIGERDPREFWDTMEAQLSELYRTAKKKGWIGTDGGRDKETTDFFMHFLTMLQDQKPPRQPS